ncbi:MAG: helix-turn-helix transcriptional regulator [Eubacteriales bacterium]|nr:helix-turn-helix transcriptional regulator [Eubacteriales bacterium]
MEQIPRRLKLYREKAGLSQAELASLIGVDTIDIIDYEKGRAMPSMEIFRRISHVCDVSTDELLIFQEELRLTGFFYGKTDE